MVRLVVGVGLACLLGCEVREAKPASAPPPRVVHVIDHGQVYPEAPPPDIQVSRERPEPTDCDEKRDKVVEKKREFAEAKRKREEYFKSQCTGTLKEEVHIDVAGHETGRGPERAWLCDGKLVDSPISTRESSIAMQIGLLQHYIRDNCR